MALKSAEAATFCETKGKAAQEDVLFNKPALILP